jgi:hypothetical protein
MLDANTMWLYARAAQEVQREREEFNAGFQMMQMTEYEMKEHWLYTAMDGISKGQSH